MDSPILLRSPNVLSPFRFARHAKPVSSPAARCLFPSSNKPPRAPTRERLAHEIVMSSRRRSLDPKMIKANSQFTYACYIMVVTCFLMATFLPQDVDFAAIGTVLVPQPDTSGYLTMPSPAYPADRRPWHDAKIGSRMEVDEDDMLGFLTDDMLYVFGALYDRFPAAVFNFRNTRMRVRGHCLDFYPSDVFQPALLSHQLCFQAESTRKIFSDAIHEIIAQDQKGELQ